MDNYFIFKGKKSTDLGVEIVEFPELQRPTRRVDTQEIDGMDGNYTIDLGSYDTYKIQFTCVINKLDKNAKTVESVMEWLSGSGKLILSTDPFKCYTARIANAIPIADVIWIFPEFKVVFEVQPFRKSVNVFDEKIVVNKPTAVYNRGDYTSLPIITMKGNGDMSLTVNGDTFNLSGVDGYVTINSEMQEVYKDDESRNTLYKTRKFPQFEVGRNQLSFTGAEEIEIVPNWRWF